MPVVSAVSHSAGATAVFPLDVSALRVGQSANGCHGNAAGSPCAKFKLGFGTVRAGL